MISKLSFLILEGKEDEFFRELKRITNKYLYIYKWERILIFYALFLTQSIFNSYNYLTLYSYILKIVKKRVNRFLTLVSMKKIHQAS